MGSVCGCCCFCCEENCDTLADSLYEITAKTIDSIPLKLSIFKGKVLIIVNVASA